MNILYENSVGNNYFIYDGETKSIIVYDKTDIDEKTNEMKVVYKTYDPGITNKKLFDLEVIYIKQAKLDTVKVEEFYD